MSPTLENHTHNSGRHRRPAAYPVLCLWNRWFWMRMDGKDFLLCLESILAIAAVPFLDFRFAYKPSTLVAPLGCLRHIPQQPLANGLLLLTLVALCQLAKFAGTSLLV
ncbi:MAG: hypothetical protein WB762_20440 [Candidatus Sulfotelmatobacter sp.]